MQTKNIITSKVERKNLKDVLDIPVFQENRDERDRTIELIDRAHQIKKLLGAERDKKSGKPVKGDENYGLLAEMADIKDELIMIQVSNDLQGLRHGRIGIQAQQMNGREYLDVTALMEAGVSREQIQSGTKHGESYYQATLFELKS